MSARRRCIGHSRRENTHFTRWFLQYDVINALKKHDTQKMLMSVKSRFYGTANHEIKSRMLEIPADVLGTAASDWIREL
ncbi:hypothetical protein RE735_09100 [Bacillus aerius]|uniref:hypothetical protein n=1 Tax=Bacillus aerius TaxID=293388 RepID=UPI0028158DC8|nr:hypothetical protein [Bacillus aerius]WMT30660.1 hypothetical protein RE735_09100 [Bacillus aerius]